MTASLLTRTITAIPDMAWTVGDHPHSVTTGVTDGATITVYEDGPAYRAELEIGDWFWLGEGTTVTEAFGAMRAAFHGHATTVTAASAVLTRLKAA